MSVENILMGMEFYKTIDELMYYTVVNKYYSKEHVEDTERFIYTVK